jgi:hypothetical protein
LTNDDAISEYTDGEGNVYLIYESSGEVTTDDGDYICTGGL